MSDNFFKSEIEKPKLDIEYQEKIEYTPYSLPRGWETLNDNEFGIVYVLCGSNTDSIIIKHKDAYCLFKTNKDNIEEFIKFNLFNDCIKAGDVYVKEKSEEVWLIEKPISKMQIKKLAPRYPTMTLNYHSANCLICFEGWKNEIKNQIISVAPGGE